MSGTGGGPLAGVLVADFSRVLAGPYATMLLADLGADVVKVEGPHGRRHPDLDAAGRAARPRRTTSASTAASARSRWTCATRRTSRLAQELARRADVVIENLRPGGMAKYGLDFGRGPAPRTPASSTRPSAASAPARARHVPGYDLMVQAISGLMSLTGDPDGPPYRAGISVFDVMAGNHAVIGILAALRHRDATGEGQHVEVNLLSSALTGLVNHSSAWVAGGVVPYRMGNAHPSVFPYEPLPTADNDLIVTAANDRQFRKLCAVLGIPEVADDPRFARNADRTAQPRRAAPDPGRASWRSTTAVEWFDLLVDAGIPCGPINTIDGGFAMAERFGLDPVVEVGEGDRALPTTRHPIRFSGHPGRLPAAAARARRARRRAAGVALGAAGTDE